jgi:hypothetical protein
MRWVTWLTGVCVAARLGGASIRRSHWRAGHAQASEDIDPEQLEAAWWAAVLGGLIDPRLRDCVERNVVILLAGTESEIRAAERELYNP